MECPKCERKIKEEEKVCPYCQFDLTTKSIDFKNFIKKKAVLIESVLTIIILFMFIMIIGINGDKETIEKQYKDLQIKSEDTSKSLQKQITEKDNKIIDSEKKITELQQEEKKKEINENIKSLENEKQELESEKQNLTKQIEELKKTSEILQQKKATTASTTKRSNNAVTTTTAQKTNSAIVYVTNTGKKYHKANCSYLKKSKIEMSMSDATSSGYTACSRCY